VARRFAGGRSEVGIQQPGQSLDGLGQTALGERQSTRTEISSRPVPRHRRVGFAQVYGVGNSRGGDDRLDHHVMEEDVQNRSDKREYHEEDVP
jgi:hypothetical protein